MKLNQNILDALSRAQAIIEFTVDGYITGANANFLEITGYELGEILGKHHSMFCKPEYANSQEYRKFWQDLADGEFVKSQFKRYGKNGKVVWLQASYNPVFDSTGRVSSIVKLAIDISETKAQSIVLESLNSAIDRALTVIEFNLDGTIRYANERILNLFGYDAAELIGAHHSTLCNREYCDTAEYREHWRRLRSGEVVSGEYVRQHKDGQPVYIYATYNPILDHAGRPFKITKFVTDMSAIKSAMRQAEAAAEAKGSFLANMSHEIRTPMNAIIGFSDLLAESITEGKQKKYLTTIQKASKSLLSLVNDILDSAKLEKGSIELEEIQFSMPELLEYVISLQQNAAHSKGISIDLEYQSGVPDFFVGDSFRIQQIVLNLLSNAVKFTDVGSVTIEVKMVQDQVNISVIDTGIGIAANRLNKIFEEFTQADASMTRKYGGTGLGTSIALNLAKLMGGDITVESEPGLGSIFTVKLPLKDANGKAIAKAAGTNLAEVRPLDILVVDDVETNLELIEILLSRDNHRIVKAANGVEAVEAFKKNKFNVILMDMQMPVMNGVDATKIIRQLEQESKSERTIIIALTANVLAKEKDDALSAGMDAFVEKPVDYVKLKTTLARELRTVSANSNPETNSVSSTALEDIDYNKAIATWGSELVHVKHLRRFYEEVQRTKTDFLANLAAADWIAVKFWIHRVRGAASNLCLPKLYNIACEIEDNLDAFKADAGEKLKDLVTVALAALEKEFAMYSETDAIVEIKNTASADAVQLIAIVESLYNKLSVGRVDNTELTKFYRLVPDHIAGPIQNDIDSFKLKDAAAKLAAYKKNL
jgi:two-component system, sensor histidine kinase and response regulator